MEQPHARYEHLWVVARYDGDLSPDLWDQRVTLVAAFRDRAAAEADAARLSDVNAGKRCEYRVLMTRLKG